MAMGVEAEVLAEAAGMLAVAVEEWDEVGVAEGEEAVDSLEEVLVAIERATIVANRGTLLVSAPLTFPEMDDLVAVGGASTALVTTVAKLATLLGTVVLPKLLRRADPTHTGRSLPDAAQWAWQRRFVVTVVMLVEVDREEWV